MKHTVIKRVSTKDYDISFEAVYKDGKAIDYKTYSQWGSLHKKDEHVKKQK